MDLQRLVQRFALLLGGLSLASGSALAYTSRYTGISPINGALEMIGRIFNAPALQNSTVQQGVIRFALFMVFMAVSFFVFNGVFKDNKTAGVISAAFSLIAAFLMPVNWVNANGSIIVAIFAGLIPIGLVGGGIFVCYKYLNHDTFTRLIAIILILLLLSVLEIYGSAMGLPLALLLPASIFRRRRK